MSGDAARLFSPAVLRAAAHSPTRTLIVDADGNLVGDGAYRVVETFTRVVSYPRFMPEVQGQDVITVHVVERTT